MVVNIKACDGNIVGTVVVIVLDETLGELGEALEDEAHGYNEWYACLGSLLLDDDKLVVLYINDDVRGVCEV